MPRAGRTAVSSPRSRHAYMHLTSLLALCHDGRPLEDLDMPERDVRQLNVRLDTGKIDRLEAVATIEDRSITELVDEAIGLLIEQRRTDPEWQERRRDFERRQAEVLEKLK